MLPNEYGEEVDCASQADVDAAVAAGKVPRVSTSISLEIRASFRIKFTAGAAVLALLGAAAPSIETWGTSAPSIVTWGTSAPSIVTWGTSAPSIVTRETSAPRIVTRETSAPSIVTRGTSAPSIVTWGASAPSIVTRETSAPSIVTRGTSAPSIVTWGTSAPSIVTWGASAPSIDANGYCQLRLRGKMTVTAGKFVAIVIIGENKATIDGGGYVINATLATPEEWCEFYGARIVGNCAVLFKGLDDGFRSSNNSFLYQPGQTQSDPNWNPDPGPECGPYGLFFSPTPRHTLEFAPDAKRFVGCLVPLVTTRVHPNGEYPQKVRSMETRGCWECDIDGNWIGELKPDFDAIAAEMSVLKPAPKQKPTRKAVSKKTPAKKARARR